MSTTNNATVNNIFKTVYGGVTKLLPEDHLLSTDIKFENRLKVGEKYVEAVVLTRETGITLTNSNDAVELNPPIAGQVQQAEVSPFISVLGSILPWAIISRSAGSGEGAFFNATNHLIKNNLKSHSTFHEIFRLYGQSEGRLGRVSYFTGQYRGKALTNGSGTVNGLTFTNGVNAAAKAILFQPGTFAAGIFTGMEGVKILQIDIQGNVVASGKLVRPETAYGYIVVDFVPVAATSETSHRICFDGMESGTKEYAGVERILSGGSGGLLFGIPTNKYSLWQGNHIDLGQTKLTLPKFGGIISDVVNRAGLMGDLAVYVNPRTWQSVAGGEESRRTYDASYKKEMDTGFDQITYHSQNGKATFKSHRMVKEGDAFVLNLQDWTRGGSSEVSFSIPGMPNDLIFPLSNQMGYAYRSFSDQFLFCHQPANSIYISGINDEAAS